MESKRKATLKVLAVLIGGVILAFALHEPPPEPGSPEALALAEKQAERERQEAAAEAAERRKMAEEAHEKQKRLNLAREQREACRKQLQEIRETEIVKRVTSVEDGAEAWIADLGWTVLNYDQKVALMRLVDCAERPPEKDPSDYVVIVRSWSNGKELGSYIDGPIDVE